LINNTFAVSITAGHFMSNFHFCCICITLQTDFAACWSFWYSANVFSIH